MEEVRGQFLEAMRRLAATVNVVTLLHDGKPMGMTATAVSSLSADPPSILVCVNQTASMHGSMSIASHFCVNILHRDQADIAQTFSTRALRDVRFESGGWIKEACAAPYLPDAQAVLICERDQIISFATHSIVIGRVDQVRLRDDIDPLVYLDGRFTHAAIG